MRKITCLLLLLCLLPSFALADKTITLTFTGDITLGGEDYLAHRRGQLLCRL